MADIYCSNNNKCIFYYFTYLFP